jgi:hypothetical protein
VAGVSWTRQRSTPQVDFTGQLPPELSEATLTSGWLGSAGRGKAQPHKLTSPASCPQKLSEATLTSGWLGSDGRGNAQPHKLTSPASCPRTFSGDADEWVAGVRWPRQRSAPQVDVIGQLPPELSEATLTRGWLGSDGRGNAQPHKLTSPASCPQNFLRRR